MTKQKVAWVWLGMKRKRCKMVWFDDTPTDLELSAGARYSSWSKDQASIQEGEKCAYIAFYQRGLNNNKCHDTPASGLSVPCQKELKKDGSSKPEG